MQRTITSDIANWLLEAQSAVVFTGAGVSTESGIPDFRSPGGIWTKFRTVYYDEFLASPKARHEHWQQKAAGYRDFAEAEPNAGHRVVSKWESAERIVGVITQNIDGLHQLAGNKNVLELHGTTREIECQDCGARYDAGPLVEQFLETDRVPECGECEGGRLKHATISFGQPLPEGILQQAIDWCESAELVFAIGSSLVVTPAADLPRLAKRTGAKLVIINRDPTPLDDLSDAVVRQPIGETLQAIDRALSQCSGES